MDLGSFCLRDLRIRQCWRSAGLKVSDQPAYSAYSPHNATVHLSAATVFLSHKTSRYSVLASFFQTSERGPVAQQRSLLVTDVRGPVASGHF